MITTVMYFIGKLKWDWYETWEVALHRTWVAALHVNQAVCELQAQKIIMGVVVGEWEKTSRMDSNVSMFQIMSNLLLV